MVYGLSLCTLCLIHLFVYFYGFRFTFSVRSTVNFVFFRSFAEFICVLLITPPSSSSPDPGFNVTFCSKKRKVKPYKKKENQKVESLCNRYNCFGNILEKKWVDLGSRTNSKSNFYNLKITANVTNKPKHHFDKHQKPTIHKTFSKLLGYLLVWN